MAYFDSFGVEHVPEEIKEFAGNKNIKAAIVRVQTNDSGMCGYFCNGFIDFVLAGEKLTDYTNLFSPHDFKRNGDKFCLILRMNEWMNEWMKVILSKQLTEQTWLSKQNLH